MEQGPGSALENLAVAPGTDPRKFYWSRGAGESPRENSNAISWDGPAGPILVCGCSRNEGRAAVIPLWEIKAQHRDCTGAALSIAAKAVHHNLHNISTIYSPVVLFKALSKWFF